MVPPPADCQVYEALFGWDGRYGPASAGALAFELVVARLIAALVLSARRALLGIAWHSRRLLLQGIEALPVEQRAAALRVALAASRKRFLRLRIWGGAHRLHLAHPFGALPAIGRRYRCIDWAWPGSNDTVFKSAHGLVDGRHTVAYSSDGGQDGAPESATFIDQAELFRCGEYIEVPLRPEAAPARFPHRTPLEP